MAIIIQRPGGIKLLLRAANAPAYPPATVPALNADVYFQYVGDAKAPTYLGTFPVGKQVEIPFATDQDRDVVVTAIGRGPLGQQNVADVRDGSSLVVQSEREQRKPVIGLVKDATNSRADIGVSFYPRHMKTRRIKVASDAGFTSIVATYYEDVDKASAETPRLPEVFRLVRSSPGAGTATYYVKVAHSSFSTALRTEATQQLKLEALRWGPDSDPLTVTFADSNGAGGSTGTFNPFIATIDGYGGAPSTFQLTVPLAGDITGALTGTSNGFADRVALWNSNDTLAYSFPIFANRNHGILKAGGFTGTAGAVNIRSDYLASGSTYSTTGTITAGQNTLVVPSGSHDFKVGHGIEVTGAGVAGAPLYTSVQSVSSNGLTITLVASASTSVVAAAVQHDDTDAVQAAVTAVASSGAALFVPEGTYRVGAFSGITNAFHIYGAGMRKSILKARVANQSVIEVTGGGFHSIHIHDLGIEGFGNTSGASGHGIYVHDNGGLVFQIMIRNVEVRLCGGRGMLLLENFSTLIDSCSVSSNGGNGFEGEFDNSCTFLNCYVHDLANGKIGYRIYSGGTVLIGCNGVDASTNADWGVFGKSLASGDDADSYARIMMIGCNVEDFTRDGVVCRAGSYISHISGTSFWAAAGHTTARAIKLDYVDGDTIGLIDAGCRFALKSGAAWQGGSPIHANNTPFIMLGNRVSGGKYFDTSLNGGAGLLVDLPYISTARNSTTNKGSVFQNSLAIAEFDSDLIPAQTNFRSLGSLTRTVKQVHVGEKIQLATGATQIVGDNVELTNGANPILKLLGTGVTGRFQVLDSSLLQIGTDTNHNLVFRTNNTDRWMVDNNGTLRPTTDNARDIGYNGGRIKDLHLAGIIYLNSAQTVFIARGTGSPEGVLTGSPGAMYVRTDGGTSTSLYVKESGTGNTGWVAHGAPTPAGITGSGTTGKVPKFSSSTALADSLISDNGTTVTVSGQELVTTANPELQLLDTGAGAIQARVKVFANDRAIVGTITNHDVTLYANNTDQWRLKAAGTFQPEGDNVRALGASANRISKGWFGTSVVTPQISFNTGETIKEVIGTGSPEGVVTASVGSTYRRTDGGTGTSLYVKESGTGNTGWVPLGAPVAGSVTGSGTTGKVPKWTASGAIGDSILSESGTTVTAAGLLAANGANTELKLTDTTSGSIEARLKVFTNDRAIVGTITNHDVTLYANNADQWRLKAAGVLQPEGDNVRALGASANRISKGWFGTSVVTPQTSFNTSETIKDLSGTGSPEGVISAAVGSTYRRTDGGASTSLYVKESGTGNTGWVAYSAGGFVSGFLAGFTVDRLNTTQIQINSGAAHIESSGKVLSVSSATTLTIPATNSTNFPTVSGTLAATGNVTLSSTTSPIALPTFGLIQIDSEVISYTGISGNTLTGCVRGARATTAASHTNGTVVTTGQWLYAYLYDNAGTPAIELSPTAPASPYFGSARSKTGNTARRFIFVVRTSYANTVFNFIYNSSSGEYNYQEAFDALPFRVLATGKNTTPWATVNAGGVVPPISQISTMRLINYGPGTGSPPNTTDTAIVSVPGDSTWRLILNPNTDVPQSVALNSSQQFTYYMFSLPGGDYGGLYMDVKAFFFLR